MFDLQDYKVISTVLYVICYPLYSQVAKWVSFQYRISHGLAFAFLGFDSTTYMDPFLIVYLLQFLVCVCMIWICSLWDFYVSHVQFYDLDFPYCMLAITIVLAMVWLLFMRLFSRFKFPFGMVVFLIVLVNEVGINIVLASWWLLLMIFIIDLVYYWLLVMSLNISCAYFVLWLWWRYPIFMKIFS